jgi:DNA-binding response OmpR family regulator
LGCPVLFITGRDLAEPYCADLMQPLDRFLSKPFKIDVLLAEVRAMLKAGAPKEAKTAKRTRVQAPRVMRARPSQ